MRNSTTTLATIALGVVLAIGSASASMARDAGGGGHMGGGGHLGGGFGGDRGGDGHMGPTPFIINPGGGFGGHPSAMSNGGSRGMGMRRGLGGDHGFDGGHHFDGFRRRHDHDDSDAFFGFGPFWPDQYWAYNDNGEAYCERLYRSYDPASGTYLGRHGVRYHCP